MRSTIPLLVVLYLLICQYLDKIKKSVKNTYYRQIALIVILCIASITNFNEVYRSVYEEVRHQQNSISNLADSYQTFDSFKDKEVDSFITNFVTKNDQDNHLLQWLIK